MKLKHKLMFVTCVASCITLPAMADNEAINSMVNANDYIVDYHAAVEQAQKTSHVIVEFPAFIPQPKQGEKYYASFDDHSQQYDFEYMINIDSTPDCHGVKYCNIGVISARKTDKIEMMKDRKNKTITQSVMLADGLDAYFTPGHAMGDFFPANIQWADDQAVYTISWSIEKPSKENLRDYLITMANSAKHPGSG